MTAVHFEDVTAALRTMYGSDLAVDAGVVHVAAVWRAPGRGFVTLRINSETPKSPYDAFVLNLTRARADAIVTSGRILRQEPDLTHAIAGPDDAGAALEKWRRDVAKKSVAPLSLVLTSGRDLDLDHPIFRGTGSAVVFTTPEAAASLADREVRSGVTFVGRTEIGPRQAVEFLRTGRGAETVSIELGPSSAAVLYDPPSLVDELLLSILDTPGIPESVVGPQFVDVATLERVFSRCSLPFRADATRSGEEWSFVRYTR